MNLIHVLDFERHFLNLIKSKIETMGRIKIIPAISMDIDNSNYRKVHQHRSKCMFLDRNINDLTFVKHNVQIAAIFDERLLKNKISLNVNCEDQEELKRINSFLESIKDVWQIILHPAAHYEDVNRIVFPEIGSIYKHTNRKFYIYNFNNCWGREDFEDLLEGIACLKKLLIGKVDLDF